MIEFDYSKNIIPDNKYISSYFNGISQIANNVNIQIDIEIYRLNKAKLD